MDSVYNEPTVYKNGLTVDDITKSIKWDEINSKLGSFNNTLFNDGGEVSIKYSKTLKLLHINGWARSTTYLNGSTNHKIFIFNNDIPGDNLNRIFGGDAIAIASGTSDQKPVNLSVRPYTFSDSTQTNSITSRGIIGGFSYNMVSAFNFILAINPDFYESFDAYINS